MSDFANDILNGVPGFTFRGRFYPSIAGGNGEGDPPAEPSDPPANDPPADPPAADPVEPGQAPAADPPEGDADKVSRSELNREIAARKAAEKEAQKLRADRRKADEDKLAAENAKKDELTRARDEATQAKDRATKLETERKMLRLQRDVERAANRLGVVDVEAAGLLLQQAGTLEFDAEDLPTNVDEALEALLVAKPYLKKADEPRRPAAPTGNPVNPPKGRSDALTLEKIQGFTSREAAERMKEITAFMDEHNKKSRAA